MAVEYSSATVSYRGDNYTKSFPFKFPIRKEEHVSVKITDTDTFIVRELKMGSDFIVVPVDNKYPSGGGMIKYPVDITLSALETSEVLTITRIVPYTQPDVYSENSTLIPKQVEYSLDFLEYQIQQLNDESLRAIHLPYGIDYSSADFINRLLEIPAETEQYTKEAGAYAERACECATESKNSASVSAEYANKAELYANSINVRTFTNVKNMVQFTNVDNNSLIRTQGYNYRGDSKGSSYMVTDYTDTAVDGDNVIRLANGLYAIKLRDNIDVDKILLEKVNIGNMINLFVQFKKINDVLVSPVGSIITSETLFLQDNIFSNQFIKDKLYLETRKE